MSSSVERVGAFVSHINLREANSVENRLERVGFSRFLQKQPSEDGADAMCCGCAGVLLYAARLVRSMFRLLCQFE